VIRNIQKSQITLNKYIVQIPDIENIEGSTDFIKRDFELLFGDIAKSDDFKLLTRIVIDKSTFLEASKEFGLNVEACKKRVQRIKKKLKENFEREK
jgi:RNA polymerase sigma-70 factor (ECF subfamily)